MGRSLAVVFAVQKTELPYPYPATNSMCEARGKQGWPPEEPTLSVCSARFAVLITNLRSTTIYALPLAYGTEKIRQVGEFVLVIVRGNSRYYTWVTSRRWIICGRIIPPPSNTRE